MRYFLIHNSPYFSFSCTSVSQEKIIKVVSDTIISNANNSLLPTASHLLFAGDLMQHQKGQINAARTPAGYSITRCFKFVKEEISRADIAVANLEVTLGGKPYHWLSCFQYQTNIFRHP